MKLPTLVFACLLLAGGVLSAGTVAEVEYFFDADPGPGNGTALYTRDSVTLDQLISAAALAPGFHRAYVRAKNDSGFWGLPQTKTFYIPNPAQPTQPPYGTVAEVEYFFDADPGLGLGTAIYSRDAVALDQLISAASLAPGFHRVYVRAKNSVGKWGMPQTKTFYIPNPAQTPQPPYGTVAEVEYFFDADPGLGNGTAIYARNAVELNPLIAAAALSPGFHRIYVRARNSAGDWGLPQTRTFYIPIPTQPSGPYKNITHLEYWLDSDPGFGAGTILPLGPGGSVDASVTLNLSGIPHGNHKLFIRLKNDAGQWGFPAWCLFSDGVPAHLTISVTEGVLSVAWEDLYTIDTYRVYTATNPEGAYTEALGGTYGDSSWSAPFAADPKRFFRVTSIYTLD